MPKKKKTLAETPDYETYLTVDEVDKQIEFHKDLLVRKDKTEFQIKQSKKEANAAHSEQLKELLEEREHELGVIDALGDRKKVLLTKSGNVVPIHAPVAR